MRLSGSRFRLEAIGEKVAIEAQREPLPVFFEPGSALGLQEHRLTGFVRDHRSRVCVHGVGGPDRIAGAVLVQTGALGIDGGGPARNQELQPISRPIR